MERGVQLKQIKLIGVWLVVAAVYFGAGKLGLSRQLAIVNSSTSAVWPPTGMAMAAVLLVGTQIWPGIFLGAFLVNLSTSLSHGATAGVAFSTSFGIAAGNTLEAIAGAYLAGRFARGKKAFDDANDIIRYTFFAAMPSTMLSATIGVTMLALGHSAGSAGLPAVWMTWWFGDWASDLVVAPLFLIWAGRLRTQVRTEDVAEAAAIVAAIILVGEMIFGGWLGWTLSKYPIEYVGIPLILWAAFRFHQRGAVTAAFLMSAIAIRGTLEERGPFAVGDQNRSLLLLQAFSGIVTVTMLVLAAAVSSRARAEQELREGEHRLRLALQARAESEARAAVVLDAAVDGIITIDERGNIETMNHATENLFGYRPEEIIGRNVKMLMPDMYADEHDRYLNSYITTGVKKIIGIGREVVGRRKDGTTFPMDLSVSEVRVEGRRVFTGIVHDITEHKRAQQEREELLLREREARGEAERTSRLKDEFLATLSHEIRTPLNAILGYASLLRSAQMGAQEIEEGLEVIDRNARMQARLIEDLLDMSRIISGKVRLEVHPVELGKVIDAAMETVRPAADGKRIQLIKSLAGDVGPIMGDAARLQQVMWNLLSNAIKFTPAGGRVEVGLRRVDSHVEATVSDSGQGIKPEFMPFMFERFRQADASTTRRHGGLGLGLSIVKHLVEMHGGSVSVKSEGEGKGSTFTIVLPQAVSESGEGLVVPRDGRANDAREAGKMPLLAGATILVVDDEADARDLMDRVFKGCGAEVRTAASVDEAVVALRDGTPDVLISDIGMPGQDGYDLIRLVRNMKNGLSSIPVVALTAFARSEDRTKAIMAGFDVHLAKPVDPFELATAVAELLKSSRAGRA